VEDVLRIQSEGAELLIETGPGRVLAGLTKRISRGLESISITDPAGFDKAMEMIHA
jgi:[acyl-carrier-protein] S-malonyltransferase